MIHDFNWVHHSTGWRCVWWSEAFDSIGSKKSSKDRSIFAFSSIFLIQGHFLILPESLFYIFWGLVMWFGITCQTASNKYTGWRCVWWSEAFDSIGSKKSSKDRSIFAFSSIFLIQGHFLILPESLFLLFLGTGDVIWDNCCSKPLTGYKTVRKNYFNQLY